MTTAATSTPSAAQPGQNLPEPPRSFYDVPGWFYRTDVILFDWFLRRQRQLRQRGDLLEMGAYMGKSAVMMRAYLEHPDERFTVCDLFDSDAPDEANGREMRGSYATLTRRAFEANFLSFHDELPRIVQAPTTVVPQEVDADSCRFVHVDASHLYEHVYGDIQAARRVLRPDGLVVLDDYRSEHTPGVACATWQAVVEGGLRPVCVSGHKFYGTWGDAEPWQDALHEALTARGKCWLQWQEVAGRRLLLVGAKKADAPGVPVSRHAQGEGARTGRAPRRLSRRVAADLLPPVLTRALLRARATRTGRAR
ncbi:MULTISPECIES: class I SAM-dependent methyltransferase [unclassified Streptomyces]|uniref:class I SAM-dependent methyltransferase n=1 Tax=unclassified Streptomyces TaxID=2593676 RepID=UPI002DD7B353|nr:MULTISPECIES: class I SAM-dependent methyltransferase [unclassified Streptomyces]WSA94397.1 class I SAM-dependent methyltransferase [Streptomyces sp. NBC_01795]WSB78815.1 class I SAM-dependent methyltransferase [Streptomyces sp. NBC_01775]WSS12982.1 class I SAM-dependent methyltransferase [Streptomyces sp. NBC_01186]WSS41765.1 class I SAM-dependent methyltransferase [Streptomyces sp. NBC_01187]